MELKESKLIKCEFSHQWSGPKGLIYYFHLEWDNNDKGLMSTNRIKEVGKDKLQTKFVIGVTQQYTVEVKENKKTGMEYLFFDKYKEPYNPNSKYSGQSRQPDPLKQRRIAKSVSLKAAIELKSLTKNAMKISEIANNILNWIEEYSKGDESRHISAQTAVNTCILYIKTLEPQERETYLDSEKFFNTCKAYSDYIIS